MNKKKIVSAIRKMLLVLAVGGCLAAGGCSRNKGGESGLTAEQLKQIPVNRTEELPAASGGFAISVAGETITADEIVTPLVRHIEPAAQTSSFAGFQQKARPVVEHFLAGKISNILLYSEAKKQAGENIDDALDKAVDSEINRFIAGFGGDMAEAEAALKDMGMDWGTFREYQKKMIMSQSYISSKLAEPGPVTYGDLIECYEQMKDEYFTRPAKIRFRLIDIDVSRIETQEPNVTAQQQAQQLASDLMERLESGADFAELAREYSHGYKAAEGGLWDAVQPDSLAEPYDIISREIGDMAVGQIAGPAGAGGHIFIVKLQEKRSKSVESFEDVQDQIEAKLRFEQRKKTVDLLSEKFAEQVAVNDSDMEKFVQFCVRQLYLVANR